MNRTTAILGFKYTVLFFMRFSFIPTPSGFDPSYSMGLFSGFYPLQNYFKRSYSVGWGCLNVELMSRRSSMCLCLYWLWVRPAKFLYSCKGHGQLLQGSFFKNPGTPPQVCDISWLWRRLTSCVACRNTRSHPDTMSRAILIEQLVYTNIQCPIPSERQEISVYHAVALYVTACKGNYAMKCQISYILKSSKWICQEISGASILGKCNEQTAFILNF